ncbi:CAP domain-containing protein [Microbacterium sp. TNHR37B]|uniref:CAP domain-containing protein n=1 Tax=Microbacterium sp. TNHR37B TaxID=1775956 RepID=UPI0007B1B2EF|nr:CAP domain-containing protein [Microbacterium sp. TNHR37B]KZE89276.1 hypothetical protein AVP41_02069 [Microbacterium sp. TNHR37B]
MISRPWRRLGVAATAVAALVVASAVATTTAHAATSTNVSCTSMTLDQVQKQILTEVNAARSKAGVPALKEYGALNTVAINWSKKQAASSTMSHNPRYAAQIPDGWSAAGENVAFGYSPQRVTDAWMNSKGHRENIERKSFTHIGIGVACNASGWPYYTQVFGGYKTLKATTPQIAGTAKAGVKLTAKPGTWTSGTKLRYQWYAGGKAVSGATAKSYTPQAKDAGKALKVKVTGSKTGYGSTSKTSKSTPKVAAPSALKLTTPKISGTAKVGKKLTLVRGSWTSGTTFTYRWYRDGKYIPGATKTSYTLTKSDKGKTISIKVTGKKSGYKTASRTSARTSTVR